MKVGIIGTGQVGAACAQSMLLRGSCTDLILLDTYETTLPDGRVARRDRGLAADLAHGEALCPLMRIRSGTYEDLIDAQVIVVTAGINERDGGAVDRSDPLGRLQLLVPNATIYKDIISQLRNTCQRAVILVVTDPPDALAEVARYYAPELCVLSAGTYLDSLRFRSAIARRIGCHPKSVAADVIGEHGTSKVCVWSSASVSGRPILDLLQSGTAIAQFKRDVDDAVTYANIDIIEGTGASQRGIGLVSARIVEAILRNEQFVAPVGTYQARYQTTLSLPTIIGSSFAIIHPPLWPEEEAALLNSANFIRSAVDRWRASVC